MYKKLNFLKNVVISYQSIVILLEFFEKKEVLKVKEKTLLSMFVQGTKLYQILTPTPSNEQKWTFYILSTLCYITYR